MAMADGADGAIIADYLAGMSVPELARAHRRTNRTIARILRAAGVAGTLCRRRDEARRGQPSPAHLRAAGLRDAGPDGPRWAYIAAFFDGEGSIVACGATGATIDADTAHRRYLVSIVQKDATPLEWMRDALGAGSIHFANGTHRYHLRGQRAVFDFLRGVERYLVVRDKRAKAEAALAALAASYGWARQDARRGEDARGGGEGEETRR